MAEVFFTILNEEGIIETKVLEGTSVSLENAKKNTEKVVEISKGKLRPIVVDIRNISSINKEARDHFAMKGRKPNVSSVALVISSPVSTMVGNFFINLSNPSVPTKLFANKEKAMAWAKKYL